MRDIRQAFIVLAQEHPEVRATLVPMTRQAEKWETMPKGWDADSRKKFWESLTGDNKHKVTKCIKEMSKGDKGIDDPGAFCAALADRVLGKGWRSKKGNGDMLQYFADNPDKLREKQERDKAKKRAFNKYNAPEVLAQLMRLLNEYGLDEPLSIIKRHKLPQTVNEAWRGREKHARRLAVLRLRRDYGKQAADIRKVLAQVFAPLQPFVKDWRKFLVSIAESLTEWSIYWADVEVLDAHPSDGDYFDWQGPQIGGYGYRGNHGYDPPEYAEAEVDVASEVTVNVKASVNLRKFPKILTDQQTSRIQDRQGFTNAALGMVQDKDAMVLFGKLLRDAWMYQVRAMDDFETTFEKDVLDVAGEEDGGWSVTYILTGDNRIKGKPRFKVSGTEIVVESEIVIGVEATEVDPPEPDFDEDSYRGRYRWASSVDPFINPKTKTIAKQIWNEIKGYMPSFEDKPNMPSNVGGIIKHLFRALGNETRSRELHSLFGNMSGVGAGLGVDRELSQAARFYASHLNEAEAVGVGMTLLRSARRPRAAKAFEQWAERNISFASADPSKSVMRKPTEVFEERVQKFAPLAKGAFREVGKPGALDFAYSVAEDINWHSLNRTGVLGEGPRDVPEGYWDMVSNVSTRLHYNLDDAAGFIVALLRLAGMRGPALQVKRTALKAFPESYWG